MTALLEMANPVWEWIIAPAFFIGLGYAAGRYFYTEVRDQWDHGYDIKHVRVIPKRLPPYDQDRIEDE